MAYEAVGIAIFVFLVLVTIIVFIWLLCVSYGYSGTTEDNDNDEDDTSTQNTTTIQQNVQTTAQDIYNNLNYPVLVRNKKISSIDPIFSQRVNNLKNSYGVKNNKIIKPLNLNLNNQYLNNNNCNCENEIYQNNLSNDEYSSSNNCLNSGKLSENSTSCCEGKNKILVISNDEKLSPDISNSGLILFDSNRINTVTLASGLKNGISLNFWNNSPVIQKIKSDLPILDDNSNSNYLELNSGEFITLLNANTVWLITNRKGNSPQKCSDSNNHEDINDSYSVNFESSNNEVSISNNHCENNIQKKDIKNINENPKQILTIDEQLKILLSSDLKP